MPTSTRSSKKLLENIVKGDFDMEEKKKIKINLKTAVIITVLVIALICTIFLGSSFSLKTTTENNLVNTVSQNTISINNTSETNSYYENMYTERQLIEI